MTTKKRRESTKSWQSVAGRRCPSTLRETGQRKVASLLTHCLAPHTTKENLKAVCVEVRQCLPQRVRTNLLKEVTSQQLDLHNPSLLIKLINLHLLSDVTHFHLTCNEEVEVNQTLPLGYHDLDDLEREMKTLGDLHLESLQMEGITLPPGLLSLILRRSPYLQYLRLSGELCNEALHFLQNHPSPCLHSLHLHTTSLTSITDQEVVRALVGTQGDLCQMTQDICLHGNLNNINPIRVSGLQHLSVVSPTVTVAGALVLMKALKNLRYFHYTWICPVADTLLLLNKISPHSNTSFSLKHLDISVPSEETLRNLVTLCPDVCHLEVESCKPDLSSLELLSGFSKLTTLHLRLVDEAIILSALKAVGSRLLELKVEFEECSLQPLSASTLTAFQSHCPNLQSFELLNVHITVESDELHIPNLINSKTKTLAFAEVQHLALSGSVSRPSVLKCLISGNKCLKSLSLNVNKDVLTDQVLTFLLQRNDLHHLTSVQLGGGCLSPSSLVSLLSLPSLSTLYLKLENFPFFIKSNFTKFQEDLLVGKYKCILGNVK
ncbi:hypothetical protein Pmani_014630 [Petrolisthes manimaculis]|uniref:Uncharacterized protein n=1 Tax=Petrolisthes manimaculis TaxID=1843537 RepID=A0AAE1PT86_9EUCA|nr:hypothetical protein Pmani_014630 [Petrolisthes manimaculis]